MKKLQLNLDDLEIESFATTPEDESEGKGTVYGYITKEYFCEPSFGGNSCNGSCQTCNGSCYTCEHSCNGSCEQTCYHSCNGSCDCGGTFAGLCTALIPC